MFARLLNRVLGIVLATVGAVAAPSAALYLIYDDNNTELNTEEVVLTIRDAANPNSVLATITATSDSATGQATVRVDNVTTNVRTGAVTGNRDVLLSATIKNAPVGQGGDGKTNQVQFLDSMFNITTDLAVNVSSTEPTYVVISKLLPNPEDIRGIGQVVNDLDFAIDWNGGEIPAEIGAGLVLQ